MGVFFHCLLGIKGKLNEKVRNGLYATFIIALAYLAFPALLAGLSTIHGREYFDVLGTAIVCTLCCEPVAVAMAMTFF